MEEGGAAYVARRQEIVRAAAHVFRDKGNEATLKDVAASLGTERASLYYYFGSKEELLREIVREALARDMDAAQTIRRSKDPTPDKIRALILSVVTSYAENYPHVNVYIEDLGRIARQDNEWAVDVIKATHQYETLVRSMLRQGQDEGTFRKDIPIDVASMALFGIVNWMHRWYRPSYPVPPDEIAHGFATIFLDGLTMSAEETSRA